jgi:Fur family ferric uptake transcriptional regulator
MSCYNPDVEELRRAGFRMTPQRQMILEALYHHPGYATVNEIWDRVREQSPHVDLSTIYRSLHFLTKQGLVSELLLSSGSAQYAPAREHPHAHAVCARCGHVMPVEPDWLQSISEIMVAQHGFHMNITSLEIPGICAECAAEDA